MDVLGDILTSTRFGGGVRCRSDLGAPWGIGFPGGRIGFHFVVRGMAWLEVSGSAPCQVLPGELVLLPHGSPHVLTDGPGSAVVPFERLMRSASEESVPRIVGGGPGARSVVVCGAFRTDQVEAHPLLSLLPPVIHLAAQQVTADTSLDHTLRLIDAELDVQRAGGSTVVARLVDVMFVYALRRWLDARPEPPTGWLGALRDREIGAALAAVHADPARRWTVAMLATTVGMSRAAFARRFTLLVGQAPLAYVTRRRIDHAALLLRETQAPLRQVAGQVGYDNEYTFIRAFRRLRGQTPGAYRATAATRADPP